MINKYIPCGKFIALIDLRRTPECDNIGEIEYYTYEADDSVRFHHSEYFEGTYEEAVEWVENAARYFPDELLSREECLALIGGGR